MKRLFTPIQRIVLGLGTMHHDIHEARRMLLRAEKNIDEVNSWLLKRACRRAILFAVVFIALSIWPFVYWVFLR